METTLPPEISLSARPAAASSVSLPSAAELAEALGDDDASWLADELAEGVVSADWLAELLGTGAGVVVCSAGAEQPTRATVAAVAAVSASGLTNRLMVIFTWGLLLVMTNVLCACSQRRPDDGFVGRSMRRLPSDPGAG